MTGARFRTGSGQLLKGGLSSVNLWREAFVVERVAVADAHTYYKTFVTSNKNSKGLLAQW